MKKSRSASSRTTPTEPIPATPESKAVATRRGGVVQRARPDYIFLHSSFRTGSTWLWSRFRTNPETCAYYEIYHPSLSDIEFRSLDSSPRSWNSHHPDEARYFLEYIPLIENKAVRYFDPRLSSEAFFPGLSSSSLADVDLTYVRNLVQVAAQAGRYPVLTCTRSLGRIGLLRQNTNGYHIVIVRNLMRQWFSYSNQYASGNGFFLSDTLNTIRVNRHKPPIDKLYEYAESMGVDFDSTTPDDNAFVIFVCYHIYLYNISTPCADMVFDLSRASGDEKYRKDGERRIAQDTRVTVSLNDISDRISNPFQIIQDRKATELCIRFLLDRMSATGMTNGSLWEFGTTLISQMWDEYDRYVFYAGDDYRQRVEVVAASQAAQATVHDLTQQGDALRGSVDELNAALHGASLYVDHVTHERNANQERCEALAAELESARSERDRFHAESTHGAAERDEMAQATSGLIDARDALTQERDALVGERDHLSHHLNLANEAIAALDQERDALGQYREAISAERERLAHLLNVANEAIFASGAEREALDHQRGALQAELDRVVGEHADLTHQLDAERAAHQTTQADRDALGAELEQFTAALDEANAKVGAIGNQLAAMQGQVQALEAALREAGDREHRSIETRDHLNLQLEALKLEHDALLGERDLLRHERDQQNAGLLEHQARADGLVLERDGLADERAELLAERGSLQSDRDSLAQDGETLRATIEDLSSEATAATGERDRLLIEADALRAERNALREDLDGATSALLGAEARAVSLGEERDRLSRESEALALARDVLRQEREALNAALEGAEAGAAALVQEREHLSREGEILAADRDTLRADLDAVEGAFRAAREQMTLLMRDRDDLTGQVAGLRAGTTDLETALNTLQSEHWAQTEKLGEAWQGIAKAEALIASLMDDAGRDRETISQQGVFIAEVAAATSALADFEALDPRTMSATSWESRIVAFEQSVSRPVDRALDPEHAAVWDTLERVRTVRSADARHKARNDYLRFFRGRPG